MKLLFFILILCYCSLIVPAQNNIYFVQGHPFEEIDTRYESVLYKLESDTLVPKYTIATSDESLLFIKIYYDFNKLVAFKDGWFHSESKRLIIIDLINPNKIIEINIDSLNYGCIYSWLIKNYVCLECINIDLDKKIIFLGININTLEQKELVAEDFKHVVLIGSPGGAIQNWDYLNVYSNPSDGKLYISKTPKVEDRPVFPVELPEEMWLREKKLLAILINNTNYFIAPIQWSETVEDEIEYSVLSILNKNINKWYKFKIKGNYETIRNFGKWLAGEVVSSDVKEIKDEKGQVIDRVFLNRVSPGIKYRRQENSKSGAPFDTRTYFTHSYYPGILYLLNLDTQQYIEWEALENGERQGDSEILLVQDEVVYYRINDKIYQAPIINGEKLGAPKLLVQDPRVPDIHWAFIAKN